MDKSETPHPSTEAVHAYLEGLRQSGAVNMWGSVPYLEQAFDMTRAEAKDALLAWIESHRKEPSSFNQEKRHD